MGGSRLVPRRTNRADPSAPNPYLDRAFNQASRGVTDRYTDAVGQTHAGFGFANRGGSGLHQEAGRELNEGLGQGLGDLATKIYGGAYEADAGRRHSAMQGDENRRLSAFEGARGREASAAALAPQYQQGQRSNIELLQGLGQGRRGYENQVSRAPYNQLVDYSNIVQANPLTQSFGSGSGSGSSFDIASPSPK